VAAWRHVLLAALLLGGCAAVPEPGGDGSIWSVHEQRYVPYRALLDRIERAQVVFLGEIHDNTEHHRDQLRVLSDLIDAGRGPALAMEQFDLGAQPALDQFAEAPGADAHRLAEAAGFDFRGWAWPLYQPIIGRAMQARLPLVAINLPAQRTRQIAREGLQAIPAARRAELRLDAPLPPSLEGGLERAIGQNHCGALPEAVVARMADAQRARDAHMAEALLPWVGRPVLVIAGRGHARRDYGVPYYLRARDPALDVIVVGMVESDAGQTPPASDEDLTSPGGAAAPQPAFDYLWFAPREAREDPCRGLRTRIPS
jgi:uncharacterized iron-regulated protein